MPQGYGFHHLSTQQVTLILYRPTLPDWARYPQARVYMVFQPARFTLLIDCPMRLWALTPLFSPLPAFPRPRSVRGGRYMSLWHFLYPVCAESFPLGSAVRYAVRTFLFSPFGLQRWNGFYAKVHQYQFGSALFRFSRCGHCDCCIQQRHDFMPCHLHLSVSLKFYDSIAERPKHLGRTHTALMFKSMLTILFWSSANSSQKAPLLP